MKKILITFVIPALLIGCTSSKFFNNGPLDATPVTQSFSIKQVDASNPYFYVYKVNEKHYALLPKYRATTTGIIGNVNRAIIFDEEQLEILRKTCNKIIQEYNLETKEGAEVIEYHLTLNRPEVAASTSVVMMDRFAFSDTDVQKFNRVVFRLQYLAQPSSAFNSGKDITCMFESQVIIMNIDALKDLFKDLHK